MKYILFSAFACCLLSVRISAQSSIKKVIYVTVRDNATGKPLPEAVVTYKGFKTRTATTDNEGKAVFTFNFYATLLNAVIEVTDGPNDGLHISGHKPFKTTIQITDKQDVYDVQVSLRSDTKGISVRVTDDENGKGLDNAKVTLKGADDLKNDIRYTDGYGNVFFDVLLIDNKKTIPVVIEKAGYESYKGSVEVSYKTDQYSLNATLKRNKNTKRLTVTVLSSLDNLPVPEAFISVNGNTFVSFFTGQTNQAGIAELVLDKGGEYEVEATQGKYYAEKKTINIKMFDDPQDYSLTFKLAPKGTKRMLRVRVYSEDEPGKLIPRRDAEVFVDDHSIGVTDAEGFVGTGVSIPLGQLITVKATAAFYGTQYSASQSVMVGGQDWRYFPPEDDRAMLILKPEKSQTLKLNMQLLDRETNRQVSEASVQIQDYSGKIIAGPITVRQGMGDNFLMVKLDEVKNQSLRIMGKAAYYEDKWDDVPAEFLTEGGERLYTIYLKKKPIIPGEEKRYGPYIITPGQWFATGLKLKKGQRFRVEAKGILRYKDPPNTENSPDGGGYWGWWQLKAKINDQLIGVGSKGGGYAMADGFIELGAPATTQMGHSEEKALEGSFTVYIFSNDAVEDKDAVQKQISQNKKPKAQADLEFVKSLQSGKQVPNRSPDEIVQQLKRITSDYTIALDWNICGPQIKVFHEYFYNRMGQPTEEQKKNYQSCLEFIVFSLDFKIKNDRL